MQPTTEDFQNELDSIFDRAMEEEKTYIDVNSGELHKKVGGYPGHNHRLPLCCKTMKNNLKEKDIIIKQPPSGQGVLIIRYQLPR